MGSDFFQEVDNNALFADVAVYTQTVTSPEQMPAALVAAVNAAIAERGVAVLSIPGDVGGLDLPKGVVVPHFVPAATAAAASRVAVQSVARVLNEATTVTLLVGRGAQGARAEVLALAEILAAPMVLSLKVKEGFEANNPWKLGQSGLIGSRPAQRTSTGVTPC